MRGKANARFFSVSVHRITPAYAGKRSTSARHSGSSGDHPRVCGEKPSIVKLIVFAIGSPPRMRGKAERNASRGRMGRITPAYAGKSARPMPSYRQHRDHPRVCGEKFISFVRGAVQHGSPPRMRGKGKRGRLSVLPLRITPAYAGKRLKRSRSTVPPAVIVPLFPSVCNKPVVSDSSPAGRDAPLFLPAENAAPASPAYNLRSL